MAGNGPEGVEMAFAIRPEVALIDIGLPGLDGNEVARRIRALLGGDEIALIAMTGYGQPEDRRRALQAGFDRYLVKPVDPAELSRLLGESRRAGEARAASCGEGKDTRTTRTKDGTDRGSASSVSSVMSCTSVCRSTA